MALFFETNNPQKLLDEFKKAIKEDRVLTWSFDEDGDFTHTPEQWTNKAWLRPVIGEDQLELYILKPKSTDITSEIYAVYHGRFMESILVHCDQFFTKGIATALPQENDNVSQG